jgi:hypothetical protein
MRSINPSLIFLLLPFLIGCYPTLDDSITDADTVITYFDSELKETNGYQNYKTFILPDTIIHIIDEEDPENNIPLSREFDEQMLSDIRSNMKAFGYTELNIEDVNESNRPDLVLLVEAAGVKNWVSSVYCYPPYWGWGGWWGYYPGYGGWGGCGTSVSSYSTGTVYINMFDPLRFDQETETPEINEAEVWLATLNGLLSSSVNNGPRLTRLIDRSFQQSPYLNQN